MEWDPERNMYTSNGPKARARDMRLENEELKRRVEELETEVHLLRSELERD